MNDNLEAKSIQSNFLLSKSSLLTCSGNKNSEEELFRFSNLFFLLFDLKNQNVSFPPIVYPTCSKTDWSLIKEVGIPS